VNVDCIVADLAERDIRLMPDGNALVVEPASKLTEDDRQTIRAHKPALLELLSRRPIEPDVECDEQDNAVQRGCNYAPSSAVTPIEHQDGPAQRRIEPAIAAELERIEGQALALGWSHERLWNSGFWYPWPRGLAAVMDAGDRIVEVTSDYMRVERPRANVMPLLLRFWRTDG
jgi:TubC N-terminal docking domain